MTLQGCETEDEYWNRAVREQRDSGWVTAEWDWLYAKPWRILHHFELTKEQSKRLWDNYLGPMQATCGRTYETPSIPGIFSRMGLPRCQRCCDRLGYPRGKGSPKNDDACRPLVEARLKRGPLA